MRLEDAVPCAPLVGNQRAVFIDADRVDDAAVLLTVNIDQALRAAAVVIRGDGQVEVVLILTIRQVEDIGVDDAYLIAVGVSIDQIHGGSPLSSTSVTSTASAFERIRELVPSGIGSKI